MPRKETYSGPLSAQAQQDLVSEGIENFELPKSVVMRIAKSSVGLETKISAETFHATMDDRYPTMSNCRRRPYFLW